MLQQCEPQEVTRSRKDVNYFWIKIVTKAYLDDRKRPNPLLLQVTFYQIFYQTHLTLCMMEISHRRSTSYRKNMACDLADRKLDRHAAQRFTASGSEKSTTKVGEIFVTSCIYIPEKERIFGPQEVQRRSG